MPEIALLSLSIVIPVYNGAESVGELVAALEALTIAGGHEIILVNDGSPDDSLAVCRRLVDESCPYNGSRPLTLVDLLPTIRLGPVVIVGVGYNDFEQTFPDSVERSLAALRKAGIEHVLWLTLRAERQSYLSMNDVIRAAAARHPELTVVDWNLYSRSHQDWFQDDGLHLNTTGSLAMATLVHKALDTLGVVAAPTLRRLTISPPTLPAARVGRPYAARLSTGAASRPVRWKLSSGRLPAGLRLRADGRLAGTPRIAGRSTPTFKATDAKGRTGSRRVTIVVRPA